MTIVTTEDVDVSPVELSIFDVKEIEAKPTFFAIYPTFYNVRLVFSPLVIQRMLQWMIREGYVNLEGTLSIRIRNKKGVLNVTS